VCDARKRVSNPNFVSWVFSIVLSFDESLRPMSRLGGAA
jgi:hypothetical protein